MYQDHELEVLPGVTASDPTEHLKTFPATAIERFTITFPKGPNREVYVRILHEATNVIPADPEEWINGENETVTVTGPWAGWDGLYQLRIQMCSPDATYPHKVIFRFDLEKLDVIQQAVGVWEQLTTRFIPWR